jgi:hypothetical protein
MGKHMFFFAILFLLIAYHANSQEAEVSNKLAYRSFSISPLGIYAGSNTGVAVSGDVSFDYGKNIFSLEFGAGTEGNFIGSNKAFTEINLLYGRSFSINDKVFTEVFVGAGYFRFNSFGVVDPTTGRKGELNESTMGFPIGGKLQFQLGPRFSLGVKVGANINSLETIGVFGVVLQWNRIRK